MHACVWQGTCICGQAYCTSDDSWLELSPEQLDKVLYEASGQRKPEQSELDLQSMVFGMKTFVDKVSSHQGAEFPW